MSFFKVLATLLVGVSLVMAVVFVFVASSRELSTLELVVFQAMTLFLSLVGSFLGGRQFADASAEQSLRSYAKSAFRRVFHLYRGLGRVAAYVAEREEETDAQTILRVEAAVRELIDTAGDALEDWREIVPEDAAALQNAVEGPSLGETDDSR